MRNLQTIAATAAIITGVVTANAAQATVTISNTGVAGAWSIVSNGNTTNRPEQLLVGVNHDAVKVANGGVPWDWVANTETSSWISTSTSGNDTPGFYTFVTNIVASADNDTLNFSFAADDGVDQALLDGQAIDIARGTYIELTDATISGIGAGKHTLAFLVFNNYPGQDNTNPTGFRLQTAEPLAAAVPEPATWLTMIVGFGLVGGILRCRKTKVAFAYLTSASPE